MGMVIGVYAVAAHGAMPAIAAIDQTMACSGRDRLRSADTEYARPYVALGLGARALLHSQG